MQVTESKKKNTVFSSSLNRTFSWFCKNLVPVVEKSIQEFWNCEVKCRLISIFDNNENIFKGDEFYVTGVTPAGANRTKNNTVLIKLSKNTCKLFLENNFGGNNFSDFSFEHLTELENRILMEFNNSVGKSILPFCKSENTSGIQSFYNLVIYLKTAHNKTGSLIVSIPVNIIEPVEIPIKEFLFDVKNFAQTLTTVSIEVGKSVTSLEELKYLEKDDIVVLENSKLNKMTLFINGETTTIKVNPDPTLIVNTDENEEKSMGENLSKDMWDTIQVEIGAEFDKIKISLGELKQISEGLVVDIGSVYENKIDLKVGSKKIATGELVIINDRYGIRIDEVFQQEKQKAESLANKEKHNKKHNAPSAQANEQYQNDNFNDMDDEIDEEAEDDYSDFDVEDEDL